MVALGGVPLLLLPGGARRASVEAGRARRAASVIAVVVFLVVDCPKGFSVDVL